jgi:hypothetical protein
MKYYKKKTRRGGTDRKVHYKIKNYKENKTLKRKKN